MLESSFNVNSHHAYSECLLISFYYKTDASFFLTVSM